MNTDKVKSVVRSLITSKISLVIAGILALLFSILKLYIISCAILVVYLLLEEYTMYTYEQKIKEREDHIKSLSSKLDPLKNNIFSMVHLPIMFLSKTGKIIWYNQNFGLEVDNIVGEYICDIIKDIKVNDIIKDGLTFYKDINIGNKVYDVYIDPLEDGAIDENEKIFTLTLYDVTEKNKMNNELLNSRESIMLIEVDNLEDAIKATDEDLRPQLIADIDRTINNYASNLEAAIKKYSDNKYVLVVKNMRIEEEMNKKFSILDTIREINCGNKLAVTLSMGIGIGGSTPMQNENFAAIAMDLALGRGGDQCVVKNFEKVSFYGGKAKEIEKPTKVRARVIGHALLDLIRESSDVFIMGHHNPDMDCMGAAIGLYSVINSLDKKCNIILDEPHDAINYVVDKYKKDDKYKETFIETNLVNSIINDKSLLILVDVHNESYVLSMDVVKCFNRIVIIDHHRKNKDLIQGSMLSYIEPYASSTSELITELIQYMVDKPKLTKIEAVSLLAGICLDTKNFCFKTGVRTFEAAAFLRRLGADTVDVKKIFSEQLDVYITRSDIIRTAKVEDGIAIAKCPPDISNLVLTAQAADELLNIVGIRASFVISRIDNDAYISGRSLGDVNVQMILESLGGGGHQTMAGARVKDTTQEEIEIKLKEAIDGYLRKGEE